MRIVLDTDAIVAGLRDGAAKLRERAKDGVTTIEDRGHPVTIWSPEARIDHARAERIERFAAEIEQIAREGA